MAVDPSNMSPNGVKLWENVFQTIPDISFFDTENVKKVRTLANFEEPFTPSRMAPFGQKLWENALQMIPDI